MAQEEAACGIPGRPRKHESTTWYDAIQIDEGAELMYYIRHPAHLGL